MLVVAAYLLLEYTYHQFSYAARYSETVAHLSVVIFKLMQACVSKIAQHSKLAHLLLLELTYKSYLAQHEH